MVSGLADATRSYGIAMIVLAFIGLIGLGATFLLPAAEPAEPQPTRHRNVPLAEKQSGIHRL